MKTIADIKKRIQLGVKIHCFNHLRNVDMGTRAVSKVQSNSFALATEVKGEVKDSWVDFPKKDEVVFNGNSFTIRKNFAYPNEAPNFKDALTYTFI